MRKRIFLLAIAAALIGCRAQKMDTSIERTTNERDSTKTELTIQNDSINQTETQETETQTETQTEEQTHINFTEGGGTYNAATGEATGVASVTTSKREKQLEKENTRLKKENQELKERLELQAESGKETQEEVKEEDHLEEATMNGWQRFIQGCGYAFLAIILAAILYGAYRIYRKFTIGI